MQTIILCGGAGTRIRKIYSDRPKCLIPIAGKPFLQWQIEWLHKNGIQNIILAAGHMAEQLTETGFTLSIEPQPLGTAGGLKYAQPHITDETFLVINGDSLAPNLDFQTLEKSREKLPNIGNNSEESSKHWKNDPESFQCLEILEKKFPMFGKFSEKVSNVWKTPLVTLAITKITAAGRYGTVEFEDDGKVTAFLEKADRSGGWVNAGVYLIHKSLLELIEPNKKISLETEIFPALVAAGLLYAIPCPPPLLDMGTPAGLAETERFLSNADFSACSE